MKHKILFVDDENLVLSGLQRSLRAMRAEWDMTFLDSGAAALQFMATDKVDVVVSDMRMPGMSGAELLNEVMRRHPRTVRLILSGHADQHLILKCVGSTHQYLSKPCDPEHLRKTITRALALETSLKSDRIQKLIARMTCLPSVPALYTEIVDQMHNPEVVLAEVGRTIAQDIGMTAQVLKLVNSAFFGLGREIASPVEAVSYLGLETIKALVLSIHAFSQFTPPPHSGFSMTKLWNHSLATASMAKRLAQMEANDRKLEDEAFVAGLLHDAGKTALAYNFPAQYGALFREIKTDDATRLAAEQAAFGVNHADVGGYLLGLWGLPTPVVEAIALHHQPQLTLSENFTPLTAVHVANALVRARGQAPLAVDMAYLDRLHLAGRLEMWCHDYHAAQPHQSL